MSKENDELTVDIEYVIINMIIKNLLAGLLLGYLCSEVAAWFMRRTR